MTLEINDPDLGRQVYSEAPSHAERSDRSIYRKEPTDDSWKAETDPACSSWDCLPRASAWPSRPATDGAESEESQAIKAQFAHQVERIKSLEVAYKLETKSNLSPEKLRAIPEYMNQLFLPQDEWHVAFKGEKRYSGRSSPSASSTWLRSTRTGCLFLPSPPPTPRH